jgi:copper chaperone CopZ
MRSFSHVSLRPVAFAMVASAMIVTSSARSTTAANLVTYEITADDMCCGGCAKKVAAQLYTAPGVVDVKANVAARTVTVFAKPSDKLTVERLWNAVEKGKGGPSKLITATGTYAFAKTQQLSDAEKAPSGMYVIVVAKLKANGAAELVGRELRGVRGVKTTVVNLDSDQLAVEPQQGVHLSTLALAAAVERAKQQPLTITGPQGRLTIEPAAPQLSSRQKSLGDVR